MAERPKPGRIYEFLKKLLGKPHVDEAGFKNIIDSRFPGRRRRPAPVCRTQTSSSNALKACSYSAFIVGELSHDRKGEQDVAIPLIDYVGSQYRAGTFALREETNGRDGAVGEGILTGGTSKAISQKVIRKHGIVAQGLPGGDQYSPESWVPSLLKSRYKLITYTGSAHTAVEYYTYFKSALPNLFNMSPGKTILKVVQDAKKRGLVLVISVADEFFEDFEKQAYREKLRTFPDAFQFGLWLDVFSHDLRQLTASIKSTRFYKLADDVYWGLIPSYSGLRYDLVIRIAWEDARMGGRIRKDRSWTLYNFHRWPANDTTARVRFEDNKAKGKHFLQAEVDLAKKRLAKLPEEQHF